MKSNEINTTDLLFWESCLRKAKIWASIDLICSILIFLSMIPLCEIYGAWAKDELYFFMGYVLPAVPILALLSFLSVFLIKNIHRVTLSSLLIAANGVLTLILYLIVVTRTGGYATSYEFYARRLLAVCFDVHLLAALLTYLAYRKVRPAPSQE